jgi:hypothetical protein
VTGLALRTIQRIESTGSASYESASAIAAVFDLPVTALRSDEVAPATRTGVGHQWFTWHRLFSMIGCGFLGAIVSNLRGGSDTMAVLRACYQNPGQRPANESVVKRYGAMQGVRCV